MFYAKSEPLPSGESLKEHTSQLLSRLDTLKSDYSFLLTEHQWEILRLAALYHDFGKVYTPFQENIKKALGKPFNKSDLDYEPHGFLSPLYLPLKEYHLTRIEKKILVQAIAYHHEKQNLYPGELKLSEIWEVDLRKKSSQIEYDFNCPIYHETQANKSPIIMMNPNSRIRPDDPYYLTYILIKGLLHRLDHAASAHVKIEIDAKVDLSEIVKKRMQQLGYHLREIQRFASQNKNKNLILIAQTGIGKTEAGLMWAGKKKTFFTLPIRVSINALYDRVYNMGYQNVGLMHSTSVNFLDEHNVENWEVISDQSRNLASKLLFTTIDQILKFPFLFLGYEKYYATMAYSAVIIDEIQAYDPKIVAVLIRALEMIHQIGGCFLIMTATLPRIYLEEMFNRGIISQKDVVMKTFYDPVLASRHKPFLVHEPIEFGLSSILESGKTKKILIICNTVRKAIDLYNSLRSHAKKIHLLHAHYIQKHRNMLEKAIQRFDKEESEGIWVTTQLVEASIDIDFDELHTEISTLDSLFQRFGRCYRRRNLDKHEPNIYIYTKNPSDSGHVYDKKIVANGLMMLEPFHDRVIGESSKVALVDKLYSKEKLIGTEFLERFQNSLSEMEERFSEPYELSAQQSQKLLRDIDSFQVIPKIFYDDKVDLFKLLETDKDQDRRREIRREILQYSVSIRPGVLYKNGKKMTNLINEVPHYRTYGNGRKFNVMPNLYILSDEYDFDEGTLTGVGINIVERSFEFE
ncbi:CRISPR-associated helicase Cas3' [Sporolactobacillus sp. CPB3-1]|uniref:CRISPR-associated helicase Cas3 n=1 Tax=Sporolactobacillus mangiferae TaxID=2940498 RepID=A0ABT0MC91_9BACL|nr:CRISPR-associated helicase Cas3' [Sporolactobacillus mangiferae]MCL1632490.1 CRISPR-associated helicase Cas3' [Sporolactobacillus mangiferae]